MNPPIKEPTITSMNSTLPENPALMPSTPPFPFTLVGSLQPSQARTEGIAARRKPKNKNKARRIG
jgi:hypothetical protein